MMTENIRDLRHRCFYKLTNLVSWGIGFKSKETIEKWSPLQNGDGTQNGSSVNVILSSDTLHIGQKIGNLLL